MLINKDKLYINIFLATFWIRVIFDFLGEEILPALENLESILFLLLDVIIAFIGIYSIRKKSDIIFALSFFIVGYWVTCVHNQYPLAFYINGLRDFIYILFLIPLFRYAFGSDHRYSLFSKSLDRSLYIFLWVQFACILFQFLKYGANDHGGGSFGMGYSGVVSTLIYLISFYLMKKRIANVDNGYFQNLMDNKDLIFLLIPTFLNETKISFIFLALYFLFLLPIDRKLIIRLLVACPILAVIMYLAFLGYSKATDNTDDITSWDYYWDAYLLAEDTDNVIRWAEYVCENDEAELEDLPRFTKLILLPDFNEEYPGHGITGYGIGQFRGGAMSSTKFYSDNEWFLRGSVPYIFHLYIQFGFIGIGFFVWFLWRLFSFKQRGGIQDKGIILFISLIMVMILFYNDSLRYTFMCIPMFYILFQSQMGKIVSEEGGHVGYGTTR